MSVSFDRLTRYGKLQEAGAAGPLSNRAGFTAFYVVGAIANLAMASTVLARGGRSADLFAPILFEVHLVRRVYECVRVHVFSPRPMSAMNFLAGLSYYVFACLTLSPLVDPGDVSPWRAALGIVLFVAANVLQHWSHRVLASLRPAASGEREYVIPTRGLFRYCDCPHYLAELALYVALLIVSPLSTARLLLVGFVALNLGHAALRTHAWYRASFPEYPCGRRALVPFVL